MKKDVSLPTATEASIIAVMTIGRIANGNVKRLNNVRAGKTISVVSGSLLVNTKTVKVEQDTRKGVLDQVKFATALEK